MVITKRVAKAGLEAIYDIAVKRLETIDEEVKARIEAEVAKEKEDLNYIIEKSSVVIEEEVPDEEPVAEVPAEENPQE